MKYTLARIYPENLSLAVKKWHVEYHYINPVTFQKVRFKVYEDINRQPPESKAEYAKTLRDAVNASLAAGYDPFGEEKLVVEDVAKEKAGRREDYSIERAIEYYLNEKKRLGKAPASIHRFTTATDFFKEWLAKEGLLHTPARDISAANILKYLDDYCVLKGWSNVTYNNHLANMHNLFNLLAKGIHGIIPKNPVQGADEKETVSRKHAAYSDEQLKAILEIVRKNKDYNMEGVILTCYYACIRSRAEMRALRSSCILYDRDLIRIEGEDAKGRRDDYVPLDPELKAFYLRHNFHKVPGDHFLFSNTGAPGPKQATYHRYAIDFREYRGKLKISDEYTLYGFKHTRNIHLAEAGVDPYALMQLNRHTSLEQTMAYLRDLGATINRKATENSRKI